MATDLHDQPVLRFRKASNFAYTPTRGSELAAGYDLYSSVDCVVKVGGRTLINTDIQVLLLPLPFHIPDQLDSFAPRLLWSDSSPQWTDSKARNWRGCWSCRSGLPWHYHGAPLQFWWRRFSCQTRRSHCSTYLRAHLHTLLGGMPDSWQDKTRCQWLWLYRRVTSVLPIEITVRNPRK